MLRILFLIILVMTLCLGASIGYFNAQPVEFFYLFGSVKLPLIALIFGVFLLAVGLTLLLCFGRILGLKGQIRRQRKQLQDTETELKNLRNLPVVSEVR